MRASHLTLCLPLHFPVQGGPFSFFQPPHLLPVLWVKPLVRFSCFLLSGVLSFASLLAVHFTSLQCSCSFLSLAETLYIFALEDLCPFFTTRQRRRPYFATSTTTLPVWDTAVDTISPSLALEYFCGRTQQETSGIFGG
ncbi:hypothetical protein Micbo1qcDRAFT_24128 [Microdochium bolleyi]|uniref:Uncharacterized protein n=1 Tax=Microdochium bolleyi TaxID=196109 RepID=A0A136JD43_9PEZI|nr:hypothetical protein Micbo1qcDRAFT_24128 [Microdochium bolleyi]